MAAPAQTLATMPLRAPAALPALVRAAFERARAAAALVFYPTQVVLLRARGVSVGRGVLPPAHLVPPPVCSCSRAHG
jgi:hypothetical protein